MFWQCNNYLVPWRRCNKHSSVCFTCQWLCRFPPRPSVRLSVCPSFDITSHHRPFWCSCLGVRATIVRLCGDCASECVPPSLGVVNSCVVIVSRSACHHRQVLRTGVWCSGHFFILCSNNHCCQTLKLALHIFTTQKHTQAFTSGRFNMNEAKASFEDSLMFELRRRRGVRHRNLVSGWSFSGSLAFSTASLELQSPTPWRLISC